MPSLIEGYNYDIFISYRQKDNKGDKWVSNFVDALKTELDSTFKKEISVYFDVNPHDGLLETHDVDESLKDKLKCLILIPIISRTYCDPEAFAWEHEFKTFIEQASKDEFGLKVKLPNGNVASRVLPVIIHDLDETDVKQCEVVLGGVMRGIEFIYKETGIDKPLALDDDDKRNLNKTKYRLQIVKLGHAIKEVINAMRKPVQEVVQPSKKVIKPTQEKKKNNKAKILIGSFLAIALVILSILFVPKLFKQKDQLDKSIAVLPFVNLSNDPEQEYFSDGMVDAILDNLFKVGGLKVISRTSAMRYKNTNLSIKDIAQELNVATILEGSVQRAGDNVRMTIQLINAKTDTHLWSDVFDGEMTNIFAFQSDVAQRVAKELKIALTSEEKEAIERNETENTEAYNLYLQGRFHIKNRTYNDYIKSIEYFERAVAVDGDYAMAYAGLADAYFLLAWYKQMPQPEAYAKSREYANIALNIDKNCADAHTVLGGILTYYDWNWEEARKEFQLAVELNPNFISAHSYYSELLDILRENSEARRQIDIVLELDPFFPMMHILSAICYYHEGKFEQSINEWEIVMELDPESNRYYNLFINYLMLGENQKAIDALEQSLLLGDSLDIKYAGMLKDESIRSDKNKILDLLIKMRFERQNPNPLSFAELYVDMGNKEEALNWLEAAFEYRVSSIPRVNNDPIYESLRKEPRFEALIEKMGLSEYQTPK